MLGNLVDDVLGNLIDDVDGNLSDDTVDGNLIDDIAILLVVWFAFRAELVIWLVFGAVWLSPPLTIWLEIRL